MQQYWHKPARYSLISRRPRRVPVLCDRSMSEFGITKTASSMALRLGSSTTPIGNFMSSHRHAALC
ncbi:hypothetical protein OE88DRAFT_1657142 [Heliocybe sulcata]|uniref:Uncharacterized protein n=1 Tax=Heliocybe sulcata TaxID=5364 RepID=A0A5C3NB53_9AGAM|nr:hypothetical protein OE88DRAFT_1657142 [Heliocybe sulcata]